MKRETSLTIMDTRAGYYTKRQKIFYVLCCFTGLSNVFMWRINGKCRLNNETNFPTAIAEISVPIPMPCREWKKRNEQAAPMAIKVISKYTLILPNSFLLACAMARTIPSPGTTITLGATSMLMPKARTTQPKKRLIPRMIQVFGENHVRAYMLTSIKALNSKLATICKSCNG